MYDNLNILILFFFSSSCYPLRDNIFNLFIFDIYNDLLFVSILFFFFFNYRQIIFFIQILLELVFRCC